jgi:hypothetical protein
MKNATTKRLILIVELDVPEHMTPDSFDLNAKFGSHLNTWCAYAPLEDNAPIRINLSHDGVEEV